MSLTVIEGFDWSQWNATKYESKDFLFEFDESASSVYFWSPSIVSGRVIGHAVKFTGPNATAEFEYFRLQKLLPSVQTELVCGFALHYTQAPGIGSQAAVFALTTDGGTDIVYFQVAADNSVKFGTSPASGVLTSSATGVITPNAWHFVELKVVVAGASSTVGCHVNGVEAIADFTCNLGATGAQYVGPFSKANTGWSNAANGNTPVAITYDDLYILDPSTGSPPTDDYLGDCHVETLFPNADGTHTDWVPNTGTVHFDRVDERTGTYPDDDLTYVEGITPGDEDSYAYDDLSITSGTVYAVQTNLYARKADSNLRQLKPLVVSGGTTYEGSSLFTLASGYVNGTEIMETDPDTALAWTVPGVNAAEFGAKIET